MTKPTRPTHYGSTRVARATRNRADWEERQRVAQDRREEAASATERVAELMREEADRAEANGREVAARAMRRAAVAREERARDRRAGGMGL